jgi:hypothetical protein
MGEHVAPCLEHCAMMSIFVLEGERVLDQIDFPLRGRDPFDRLRLLREQRVDVIICGGVQDAYEQALAAYDWEVISWVSGEVDALLELYLRGRLVSGTRLSQPARRGG